MNSDYRIFVITDPRFGQMTMLSYRDRETANAIWQSFHWSKIPTITVHENKLRVWDCPMNRQPVDVDFHGWPEFARMTYLKHEKQPGYFGAHVVDYEQLGCCEFSERFQLEAGLTKRIRTFFTYKGGKLFTVEEYD